MNKLLTTTLHLNWLIEAVLQMVHISSVGSIAFPYPQILTLLWIAKKNLPKLIWSTWKVYVAAITALFPLTGLSWTYFSEITFLKVECNHHLHIFRNIQRSDISLVLHCCFLREIYFTNPFKMLKWNVYLWNCSNEFSKMNGKPVCFGTKSDLYTLVGKNSALELGILSKVIPLRLASRQYLVLPHVYPTVQSGSVSSHLLLY